MAAEIAIAVPEKIVDSIVEEFIIRPFKDCYNLDDNHEDLNENIQNMELELHHARTQFEAERRVRQDLVENCITKMQDEVKKAKELSVRIEKRGSPCFLCWNLCYPKLSKECRERNTKFVHLFEELHSKIHFVADVEQVVTCAKAGPVLPLPVPVAGFVGSDIKYAERQLQEWLTQSKPPHRVVGVWGMGGIGKSSLLETIHNHFQKVSSIFEIVMCVTVSQNFKVEGFYNSIAKALDMKLDEKIDSNRARTEVCTFLENKKFLLILDDLWECIDFEEVGFSFGNVDSKVLISTRSAEVIAAMGARECSLKMQILSEDEAWELFKRKAFINGPAALDRNIEVIAKEIAKECKGLPLALNVVGAAMTGKETEKDWDGALKMMRYADPYFPKAHKGIDAKLYQKLRYSYNDLTDHKLKCCFLYCAAFPEDEEINAERLVEIWIAEGLLTGRETADLMDVGHVYLNLLANRCLIQYVVPGEYVGSGTFYEYVKTIKIHDVLRDMAIHIVESESEEHCLFATNQHRKDFPGEREVSNCKRISLGHNDIQDLPTDLMKCPNLVSLLLHSNQKLSRVPEQFLSSVTSLRVLDLSWTGITGLPTSVGKLTQLEFLDLSYCGKLKELPENIGSLSALQFFNLKGCCRLKGLPSTIRGLKKLNHLNLEWCDMELNSDDIGQLISLNRLVVSLAVRAGDLINLTNLGVLEADVTADGGDVVTIDTWKEMRRLKLLFLSDGVNIEKIERVEMLKLIYYSGVTLPHCEFEYLKLLLLRTCEVRELPLRSFPMLTVLELHNLSKLKSLSGPSNVWKEGSMSKLQQLTIVECPLLKLPLRMRLPNLKLLSINMCESIKELDIGNGDFPRLEKLHLESLNQLESITGSSGVWNEEATSKIEKVEISYCPSLKKLPLGMRLPNLKVLWIKRCDSIKELDIGNGDFPMLERLDLYRLKGLESIRGSSGVWNEEATSKLESVKITDCALLRRLPRAMEKLFSLNKLHWEDRDESVVLSELFGE